MAWNIPLWQARQGRQVQSLLSSVERRLGPSWERITTSQLEPPEERIVAHLVFYLLLADAARNFVANPEPKWVQVAPERGWFRLEGEGEHPTFMFRVPTPYGGTSGWGWAVGTSSLGQ